ncbi:hypothetical protein PSTT_01855 [Puccinia striiformis]|uniref:Myb/SANT-like domain-containing protein n=1 Tax=Puccinia striiformis TaxID=27350 RepID=A0A2S4W245_9BASI|nr:hypothetical protein PSTT_01855 [Puccinia striiformis]
MNLDPDLFAALMQPLPKQTTESSPAPPMDPIESTPAVAPAPAQNASTKKKFKFSKPNSDKQEAEAEGEEDDDDGKKGNHTWTPNQETALIQYILDQKALGKGTDNANLKAKGWTQVSRDMYNKFKIEFTNIQLKNQKGYMQKLYVDQDFLRSQSGFGWDKTAKMVTANPEVWNTLIQAHPNRKFATLLATPFEWSSHTGKTALRPGELPPDPNEADNNDNSAAQSGLSANSIKTLKIKPPPKEDPSSNEHNNVEVIPKNGSRNAASTQTPATKCVCGCKYGVEDLVRAIQETSSTANIKPPFNQETKSVIVGARQEALERIPSMFLDEVTTNKYIQFIQVVQSEENTEFFISLAKTTESCVCKAWLTASAPSIH